jgi:hypothetical protein
MGHGHVILNENGSRARCGGPAICSECARELASVANNPGEAVFSTCGEYRYILTRRNLKTSVRWVKPALFIMLNPSTADAINNDPTIRRCISFAENAGCTSLVVVNLFALRATNPKELKKHKDPIGPENDFFIEKMIRMHKRNFGIVVAAWGANPVAKERGRALIEKYGPFLCLGVTKNGNPKHPLYVKADQPLVEIK